MRNRTGRALLTALLMLVIVVYAVALIQSIGSVPEPRVRVSCTPINYGSEHITMDMRVPNVSGLADRDFEELLNQRIYDQIKTAARAGETEARAFYAQFAASDIEPCHHVFSVLYDVKNDSGILSLKVTTYLHNGGPGMPRTKVYNVDIEKCTRLQLGDLFRCNTPWQARIDAVIEAAMQAHPAPYFEPYAFAGVSDDTQFFIQEGSLFILFAKYEIADGMTGEPVFEIPPDAIQGLVKREYRDVFR